MAAKPLKCKELREKTIPELEELLEAYKEEMLGLRIAKVTTRTPQKFSRLRTARHDVARINTVLSEKAREAAKAKYAGKRRKPVDLRARRTRALRRALTKKERSIRSHKAVRKALAFPQRRYAVVM